MLHKYDKEVSLLSLRRYIKDACLHEFVYINNDICLVYGCRLY